MKNNTPLEKPIIQSVVALYKGGWEGQLAYLENECHVIQATVVKCMSGIDAGNFVLFSFPFIFSLESYQSFESSPEPSRQGLPQSFITRQD